ncbi:hypothetical protein H6P81_007367 [Aristolochia fimbriata]|uniref:Integrase catalytic domain-containing protein n=1 Tax=Aristolochia fimbriata TaxID=158543 RepID=A0AAV7F071_ARIFI|nr:hypothetical protein H6P81_007367 [Aristolochia fimbriata]
MKGKKIGTLYVLDGSTVIGSAVVASSSMTESDTIKLWHMRLSHMSERGLNLLSKRGLLWGESTGKMVFCEHCIFDKQKRVAFSTGIHRKKGTLDYIHSDIWGPAQVVSKGGARDIFTNFKQWKCVIEKQTGRQIKRLKIDNGLEFYSGEFNKFCNDEGIVRHHTVRHTPQQNDITERMNRTLLERARCMLSNAGLGKDFWAEATSMTCYLVNRSPSTAIECKTPEEKESTISLGTREEPEYSKKVVCEVGVSSKASKGQVCSQEVAQDTTEEEDGGSSEPIVETENYRIARDRPRREIQKPKKYSDVDLVAYALSIAETIDESVPSTYKEAIQSDNLER